MESHFRDSNCMKTIESCMHLSQQVKKIILFHSKIGPKFDILMLSAACVCIQNSSSSYRQEWLGRRPPRGVQCPRCRRTTCRRSGCSYSRRCRRETELAEWTRRICSRSSGFVWNHALKTTAVQLLLLPTLLVKSCSASIISQSGNIIYIGRRDANNMKEKQASELSSKCANLECDDT